MVPPVTYKGWGEGSATKMRDALTPDPLPKGEGEWKVANHFNLADTARTYPNTAAPAPLLQGGGGRADGGAKGRGAATRFARPPPRWRPCSRCRRRRRRAAGHGPASSSPSGWGRSPRRRPNGAAACS